MTHHIGRVLDLDDLVPRVIHEAVVVLVRRQVAVVVVDRGGGAADTGDLVLPVFSGDVIRAKQVYIACNCHLLSIFFQIFQYSFFLFRYKEE